MIDRIGELLAELAAENEEEQREEDVPALPIEEETVPVPPRGAEGDGRGGGRTAEKRGAAVSSGPGSERSESGEVPEGRTALAQPESLERAANRRNVTVGETETESMRAGRELWKAGPVWTVRSADPEMDEAQRAAPTGRTAQAGPEQAGLKRLYRQTVRGLRPAVPALPPEQAGKTARAQEPGDAASLAVDELDRAVRRDSRRYDGGMSIY